MLVGFQLNHPRLQSAPGMLSCEQLASSSKPLGSRMWGGYAAEEAVSGLNLVNYGPQTGTQSQLLFVSGADQEVRTPWFTSKQPQVVMLNSVRDRGSVPISNQCRETGKFTQQMRQAGHIFVLPFPMH